MQGLHNAIVGSASAALLFVAGLAQAPAGPGVADPAAARATGIEFEMLRKPQEIIARGTVASATHAESLELALTRRFPEAARKTDFTIGEQADADWQLLTLAAVDLVAETSSATATFTANRADIRGVAPEENLFDARLGRLEQVAGPNYTLEVTVLRANPATSPPDACDVMFRSIRGEAVRFRSGTAELRSSSYALLDRYAEFAADCPGAGLKITGHSDSAGEEAFNLLLSRQRALEVVDYLKAAGVAAEQLAHDAAGSSEPIADNSSSWGRSLNRRIEFELFEPAHAQGPDGP